MVVGIQAATVGVAVGGTGVAVGGMGVLVGVSVGNGRTVHSYVSAVGSIFPAGSIARTRKVWSPTVSPVYVTGDVQLEERPSNAQEKVEPGALEEKVKVARVLVESVGPKSIVVSGGVVSAITTVQL